MTMFPRWNMRKMNCFWRKQQTLNIIIPSLIFTWCISVQGYRFIKCNFRQACILSRITLFSCIVDIALTLCIKTWIKSLEMKTDAREEWDLKWWDRHVSIEVEQNRNKVFYEFHAVNWCFLSCVFCLHIMLKRKWNFSFFVNRWLQMMY